MPLASLLATSLAACSGGRDEMCCRRDPEACGWLSPESEASKTRCENISETLAAGARTWKHPRTTACPKSWLEPLNVAGWPFCLEPACGAPPDCRAWQAVLNQRPPSESRCASDDDCGAPHGACVTATGRCRCNRDWGGHDCRHDNSQTASSKSAYNETVFARHYKAIPWHVRQWKNKTRNRAAASLSLSGPGSSALTTRGLRAALPSVLRWLGAKSVADAPVGDFNYMREVLSSAETPALEYFGLDIVAPLIANLRSAYANDKWGPDGATTVNFFKFDIAEQTLWPVDVVIVRDVLFHFSPERALEVLRRIDRSGSKWLLTTTHPRTVNAEAQRAFHPGRGFGSFWRINLEDQPFCLPPPLLAIGRDGEFQFGTDKPETRIVGLWRLPLWPGWLYN